MTYLKKRKIRAMPGKEQDRRVSAETSTSTGKVISSSKLALQRIALGPCLIGQSMNS